MKAKIDIEVEITDRIGNHVMGTWSGKLRTEKGVSQLRDRGVLVESVANVLLNQKLAPGIEEIFTIRMFGSDNMTLMLGDGHDDDTGFEGRWLAEVEEKN